MGMDCGGVTCIRANSSTRKSDLYSYLIDADMYFLPFHAVEVLWFNVNNDFLYLCAYIGGFGGGGLLLLCTSCTMEFGGKIAPNHKISVLYKHLFFILIAASCLLMLYYN